jgi:O-antigen ligase
MTLICGVLLALAISASFSDLRESALIRVGKLFDRSLTIEEATSRRSILISEGWHIFRENPLGVGTGGYALTAAPGAAQAFAGNAMQAHSAWVKTLAENGVPGIALLAAFVASYAFAGWRRRSLDAVLMGGLTTAVLGLAFLSTEFAIKGLWFLAMGVSILLHHQPYARRSTV